MTSTDNLRKGDTLMLPTMTLLIGTRSENPLRSVRKDGTSMDPPLVIQYPTRIQTEIPKTVL